jgi:diguanylate cyclase (GGDEF)-like protein/PAS domain S-box-containing protein
VVGLLLVAGWTIGGSHRGVWNQAALTAASLGTVALVGFARMRDTDVDRPARTATLATVSAFAFFEVMALLRGTVGIEPGAVLEYPLLAVMIGAAALIWRAMMRGRLTGSQALAASMDSAVMTSIVVAAVLLLLGPEQLERASTTGPLLMAAFSFGLAAAIVVLCFWLTPVLQPRGWGMAVAGMLVCGIGFSIGVGHPVPSGADPSLAIVALGLLLAGFGAANTTLAVGTISSDTPGRHPLRDLLPTAGAAAAPFLLIANEVLGGEGDQPIHLGANIALGTALLIVVLRQTLLIWERDGMVRRTLEAADRERGLHAGIETSERRFRALLSAASDVFLVIDAVGTVFYQSPAVEQVLGYRPEDRLGRKMFELTHPDDLPYLLTSIEEVALQPGGQRNAEYRALHKDGSYRVVDATIRNLLEDEAVRGIVINYRDVTEQRELERQLRHEAFHDSLTGLANRALLIDRVEHAMLRRRRNRALAVMFMDLDDFKTINDSLGHAAGDNVLQAVAERLRACLRLEDTIARPGGDEFAMLVEDSTPAAVEALAGRVLDGLRAPFDVAGRPLQIGASIGVAMVGADPVSADELLRDADAAMYIAKARGKGRVEVFRTSMHAAAVTRLEIKSGLEHAIEREELRLRYQPIFHLRSGRLTGVEALVRWRRPAGREVPPAEFIALAEETGLIDSIGRWVLTQACRQAQAWREAGHADLHLCVNLSPRQLRQASIVDVLADTLEQSGLDPSALTLELTESGMVLEDGPRLHELRSLGVQLSLDDFGTGYSSLTHLARLPVSVLKIDRSFVSQLDRTSDGTALVTSVIQLAGALNMTTVAEGIERPEQLALLRELGCDYGQGFLLARPLDPIRAGALLGRSVPALERLLAS